MNANQGQELRTRRCEVEDSKCFLKQAIFTRGGERLQEEIQLARQLLRQWQEQQQLEEQKRWFDEMLECNSEE
ncbi:MAG: hypothetical protein Q9175_003051 [Cornicularia normoerica]